MIGISLLGVQCLNLRPLEPPLYAWFVSVCRERLVAAATSWSCIERGMATLALLLTALPNPLYRQRGLAT